MRESKNEYPWILEYDIAKGIINSIISNKRQLHALALSMILFFSIKKVRAN